MLKLNIEQCVIFYFQFMQIHRKNPILKYGLASRQLGFFSDCD